MYGATFRKQDLWSVWPRSACSSWEGVSRPWIKLALPSCGFSNWDLNMGLFLCNFSSQLLSWTLSLTHFGFRSPADFYYYGSTRGQLLNYSLLIQNCCELKVFLCCAFELWQTVVWEALCSFKTRCFPAFFPFSGLSAIFKKSYSMWRLHYIAVLISVPFLSHCFPSFWILLWFPSTSLTF